MRALVVVCKAAMTAAILALVMLLLGCAGFRPFPPIVLQANDTDCAIAAIATATHRPYARIAADATALGIQYAEKKGTTPGEFFRLAKKEGLHLVVPTPDIVPFSQVEGFLILQFPNGDIHIVYVDRGWIHDSEARDPYPWTLVGKAVISFLQIVR